MTTSGERRSWSDMEPGSSLFYARPRTDGPEPVGFLLIPQFSMMAFLSAIEPLRVANRLAGRKLFEWRVFSADGQPVEGSNGMSMMVEDRFSGACPVPMLFVCAGFEPEAGDVAPILGSLRKLARRGVALGAIDTGVWLLARADVLGGATVTLHWEALPAFREAFPDIPTADELFKVSHGRITCAGGTAAIDMMLAMIAAKHGERLALAVSEQFIHDRIRDRHAQQRIETGRRLGVTDSRILAAIAEMERRLEKPWPSSRLADRVDLSVRHLERLFHEHLGVTPAAYYLGLRLERARQLLRQTDMALADIAAACGFNAASSLSRAYKARFRIAPNFDRRELSASPPGQGLAVGTGAAAASSASVPR